jgi:hypothetical protein
VPQLDVRNGRVSFEDVLAEADDLQRRLESCLEDSPLPERPDYEGVNGFLAYTYRALAGPDAAPRDDLGALIGTRPSKRAPILRTSPAR